MKFARAEVQCKYDAQTRTLLLDVCGTDQSRDVAGGGREQESATAARPLGRGAIAFRTMLSLEPATISRPRYPELFQTGETAFGKQLIDA